MNKNKLTDVVFKKEIFINDNKATYSDLIWLLVNLELDKILIKKIIKQKSKIFIKTY